VKGAAHVLSIAERRRCSGELGGTSSINSTNRCVRPRKADRMAITRGAFPVSRAAASAAAVGSAPTLGYRR